MAPSSHGLLGGIQRANDPEAERYGPNGAEVHAFIQGVPVLTPAQWAEVGAARRLVAAVTKETSGHEAESIRSLLAGVRGGDGKLPEPMAAVGYGLLDSLENRSDDELVAAWQAVSALVRRHQLPAIKFAAHYAPFAYTIPVVNAAALDPTATRYVSAIERLTAQQCGTLGRPWRLDPEASGILAQAVVKSSVRETEEAVALAALAAIPPHLSGDAGWAAVKNAVHGGRVLSCRAELSREQLVALWTPVEKAIALASLIDVPEAKPPRTRARAAVPPPIGGRARERGVEHATAPRARKPAATAKATAEGKAPRPRRTTRTAKAPKAAADSAAEVASTAAPAAAAAPRAPARSGAPAPAAYGPNSAEVAAFVKAIPQLTPIQWLRVLDRRQLVASVTREGTAEPAGVVRSILAAIDGTKGLDTEVRCKAFAAVERAGFAVETRSNLTWDQVAQTYGPFASLIPLDSVDAGSFAPRLAGLSAADWAQVAASGPEVNVEAIADLVSAGESLSGFLAGRSDDEAVATWHAVSALVRRHQLSPIKFAVSYAPFASAIPVINPKSLTAGVQRFVSAIGRLSANQCALLAQPYQVADDASNALSRAVADGSARAAEEAAAMAAVVTVPMRMTGNTGWAAVRTAALGGRVVASRARLTPQEMEALWQPIERAIPLASVEADAKARR